MYLKKESVQDSQGSNNSAEFRDRFKDLLNQGNAHGVSSLQWLNAFKQKYPQPNNENDITIGYSQDK